MYTTIHRDRDREILQNSHTQKRTYRSSIRLSLSPSPLSLSLSPYVFLSLTYTHSRTDNKRAHADIYIYIYIERDRVRDRYIYREMNIFLLNRVLLNSLLFSKWKRTNKNDKQNIGLFFFVFAAGKWIRHCFYFVILKHASLPTPMYF